jgi:hypothetical protein
MKWQVDYSALVRKDNLNNKSLLVWAFLSYHKFMLIKIYTQIIIKYFYLTNTYKKDRKIKL